MRSQSVAFRFSCSCKETSRQDETYAFNSVFPDTPLLGLDVFGEIGWDTVVFHNECNYFRVFFFVIVSSLSICSRREFHAKEA